MRLRYVDPQVPGLSRRRRGRGFELLAVDGGRLEDAETIDRIRGLAIPPAWTDVWICPWPNGHLQATGRDAAGRLQYVYHEAWRAERDREKFARMLDFGAALPALRAHVSSDLAGRRLSRERLLACATRLLDRGLFRIGSEEYARDNGTVGVTTLNRGDVRLAADGTIAFSYVAKGGRRRTLRLADPDASRVLAGLKRRRARAELFAYRNGHGDAALRSVDVNAYIRTHAGGPYSAKDFRTWHATVLAAVAVAVLGSRARTERARRHVVSQSAREVARYLGNTPAVCRESYIDPRVFEYFYDGRTIDVDLEAPVAPWPDDDLRAEERAVLDLLGS